MLNGKYILTQQNYPVKKLKIITYKLNTPFEEKI